jgi:hypothetical protein
MNVEAAPFQTESFEARPKLLLAEWLKRQIPPRDYLLGDVLCTTSRWILYGETGVGKSLLCGDIAGAVASGSALLNWGARRLARVMYIDGEMPAETFKERMQIIADRYGGDLKLYGYNRDDLKEGEMLPLNTEVGEKWLWREIAAVKPDLVIFDSIMCLLIGSMSEEESWAPIKPLMRKLSTRRIAQIWMHHTGHDTSKGFGTKTKEWEVDTVVSLTKVDGDGEGCALEFKKARLRVPATKEQFESRIIRLDPEGWTSEGGRVVNLRGVGSIEQENVRRAILRAYDHLSDGVEASPGFDGAPVRKVPVASIRDEVKSRGFLETVDTGGLSNTARSLFRRAKTDLITNGKLVEKDDLIWRPIIVMEARR